jgi:hypothetical protein
MSLDNQEGLEFNGTHKLLVHDDDKLLGKMIHNIGKTKKLY